MWDFLIIIVQRHKTLVCIIINDNVPSPDCTGTMSKIGSHFKSLSIRSYIYRKTVYISCGKRVTCIQITINRKKVIAGRKSGNYFYLSIIIHFASKASKCSVISGSEGLGAKDSTILNSLSIKIKRGIYLICQFTLNPSLSTELN